MLRKIEAIDIIYEKSRNVLINPNEYYSYLQLGYTESPNGTRNSGKIRMVKGAKIHLVFKALNDTERHVQNVSLLVYDAYKKKRLSEKQAKDFFNDYKSILQELMQTDKRSFVYELIDEQGPSHDKTFTIVVRIDNVIYGKGIASSKKEACQLAAKDTLEKLAVKGDGFNE